MAFTTEFVMGAGGVEVETIPVDIVADGGNDSRVIMHTVDVPEGETWLVALAGDLNPHYTNRYSPQLFIGEVSIGPSLPAGRTVIAAEVTGTAEISLKRNNNLGTDIFSGHVYTVPLPN